MKAYFINKYQKQPTTLGQQPTPTINENQILVEVKAAGLNHLDLRIKSNGGECNRLITNKKQNI